MAVKRSASLEVDLASVRAEARRDPDRFLAELSNYGDGRSNEALGRLVSAGCRKQELLRLIRVAGLVGARRDAERKLAAGGGRISSLRRQGMSRRRLVSLPTSLQELALEIERLNRSELMSICTLLIGESLPDIDHDESWGSVDLGVLEPADRGLFDGSFERLPSVLRDFAVFASRTLEKARNEFSRLMDVCAQEQEVLLVRHVARRTGAARFADIARLLYASADFYSGGAVDETSYSEAALKMRFRRYPKTRTPISLG